METTPEDKTQKTPINSAVESVKPVVGSLYWILYTLTYYNYCFS